MIANCLRRRTMTSVLMVNHKGEVEVVYISINEEGLIPLRRYKALFELNYITRGYAHQLLRLARLPAPSRPDVVNCIESGERRPG